MGERGSWSAAGGAIAALAATNAVVWAVAAAPKGARLPSWPAIAFGALALVGLYVMIASLLSLPPFGRVRSVAELLDRYIREGRDAREHITLDPMEASEVVTTWTLRVVVGLSRQFPAIVDEFLLASGDQQSFSGQALLIQTINARLAIPGATRKRLLA